MRNGFKKLLVAAGVAVAAGLLAAGGGGAAPETSSKPAKATTSTVRADATSHTSTTATRAKTPVEISAVQAQAFKSIVGFNSRYVQPLNGREVLEDSAVD